MVRDAFKIIGAKKSVREMVGENRQYDIEGMAQQVDDRRLREDQAYQAEMRLIERHLVGEPARSLADGAELACALQIIVTNVVERLCLIAEPQISECFGICKRAAQHAREQVCNLVD